MAITVASTEDLDAATRAEIIRVCIAAHDEPDFERLFEYIPSGGRHFMAYHGRQLASHAVVTTRWLEAPGGCLKSGYVDAVATLPDYQGQGFGSAVMQALAQNLDDYDIGCLQTDIPEFYTRLGWELWRGPLAGRRGQEVIATPDQQGIMVLRVGRTPALDLDGDLTVDAQEGRIW
jgi:aminoglycoside 2'-N-acetyltransferase I